jgi:two-component system chemotaxis sensor kinase CheA
MTMNLDAALQTFLAESRELLDTMEEVLLRLEHESADADLINALFRTVHTIKGSAGVFGLDDIVAFTHDVESLLDMMRNEAVIITPEIIALLLVCCDHTRSLVEPIGSGQSLHQAMQAQEATLVAQLRHYLQPQAQTHQAGPGPDAARRALPAAGVGEERHVATDDWHISLRFGCEVLRNGMDPLSFLRYLTTLGTIAHLTTLTEALPEAAVMDPEACYLGFEIRFTSQADKATIENVFEFVRDDCAIRILPPRSKIADYIRNSATARSGN